MDGDKVEQVLREFDRLGVDYKIFGGVALNLHGLPRFTEDLDRADAELLAERFGLED